MFIIYSVMEHSFVVYCSVVVCSQLRGGVHACGVGAAQLLP